MTRSNSLRIAVCLAILFVLFAYPAPAKACSCIVAGPPSYEFSQADAVFTGKVIRIVDNYYPVFALLDWVMSKLGGSYRFYDGRFYGYSVLFAVDESWKGVKETTVEVHTGYGGGDCGYSFNVGNDYVVYANHAYGVPGNYWVTSICSRTAEASNAVDDFQYLNTLPTLPLKFNFPVLWTDLVCLSVMLLIGMVSMVIFIRRQKQHQT